MNTNIANIEDITVEKIIIFLKECLNQLINYNSINSEDLKKICAINYKQLSDNNNKRIQNYLINIFGEINSSTKIYNLSSEYIENFDILFRDVLNHQFLLGIK